MRGSISVPVRQGAGRCTTKSVIAINFTLSSLYGDNILMNLEDISMNVYDCVCRIGRLGLFIFLNIFNM